MNTEYTDNDRLSDLYAKMHRVKTLLMYGELSDDATFDTLLTAMKSNNWHLQQIPDHDCFADLNEYYDAVDLKTAWLETLYISGDDWRVDEKIHIICKDGTENGHSGFEVENNHIQINS